MPSPYTSRQALGVALFNSGALPDLGACLALADSVEHHLDGMGWRLGETGGPPPPTSPSVVRAYFAVLGATAEEAEAVLARLGPKMVPSDPAEVQRMVVETLTEVRRERATIEGEVERCAGGPSLESRSFSLAIKPRP